MHVEIANINVDTIVNTKPIEPAKSLRFYLITFLLAGIIAFSIGILSDEAAHVWGVYLVNVSFFMGLAAGSVMLAVIFQITRAIWSGSLRRLAEANVVFLPIGLILLMITYFGKEYLYPWATSDMPGREAWMQPNFVYVRMFALFAVLFYMMWRFVALSFRQDIGLIREKTGIPKTWSGWFFDYVTKGWRGSATEIKDVNRKLSFRAPIIVFIYSVVFTLFGFEMILGMDTSFVSNLFGAYIFVGNIYIAWAALSISALYHASRKKELDNAIMSQQFWDLGKLTFGFCMIWGYFFFSQFLPQWYGNLPEETQWMILRTREFPWKGLGWITFAMSFICPFILLLSEDTKKNPVTLTFISIIILIGVWCERYMEIMPQITPDYIPFNFYDLLITLGFLGAYVLTIQWALSKLPCIAIAHPLTHGKRDW